MALLVQVLEVPDGNQANVWTALPGQSTGCFCPLVVKVAVAATAWMTPEEFTKQA